MMARGPAAATATRISCCGLAACSTQNCHGLYRRAAQLRSVLLWIHFRKYSHLRARALQVLASHRAICPAICPAPQMITRSRLCSGPTSRLSSAAPSAALALCTGSSTETSGMRALYRCGGFGRYTHHAVKIGSFRQVSYAKNPFI